MCQRNGEPSGLRVTEDPLFGFAHGFVELIEASDCKQKMVDAIHRHGSIENFLEIEFLNFAASSQEIGTLAVRDDDATAIYFRGSVFKNQPEFNGVPEEAAEPLQGARISILAHTAPSCCRESANTLWACMGTWPKTS